MAGPLTRFTLELDGVRYIVEAPADTSPEDLAAAVQQQKPETVTAEPSKTPQSQGGDLPDGPPKYEPHVGGLIAGQIVNGDTNIDHYDDDGNYIGPPDPVDVNFDPAKGTALPAGVTPEEETRPAVDANLGQADLGNRVRAVTTGALPSFEDELEGMYRTYNKERPSITVPIPGFPGGGIPLGMPWGDDYTRERDKVRDDFGLYQQRNPLESAGLEFGGALATSMVPGMGVLGNSMLMGRRVTPLAKAALLGGGVGMVSGAGAADELGDVPLNAAGTGALGVITSPLALLGGKAAGGGGRWLANRMTPSRASTAEEAAGDVLHEGLRRAGMTPDELAAKAAEDRALGIPTMLGDYLVDGADAALRVPSAGRSAHLSALYDRQIAARERTQSQLNDAFGNPQEFYDTEEKLLEAGRTRANDVYDAAYAVGDVRDPQLIKMLKGKSMQKFWVRAKEIADLDAEAAVARGEDPTPYKLKPLFEEVDDGGGYSAIKRTDAVPDVRTLDYIKKGMSDEIDSLYKGTSSAGKQQATGLRKLYDAYVKHVDHLVPEYKAARQVYAGDLEVRDALEAGRSITKLVPAQVRKLMKGASAGELDALRTGAYEGFRKMIDDPTTNRNWGKIFSMPGKVRDNLRTILPKKEYELLQTIFNRESEIFSTSGSRMAGSQTIGRKEAIDDIDRTIQDSDLVGTAASLATSSGRMKAVFDFLSNRLVNPEKRDRVYTLLNKVYRAGHPDDIMEALELLKTTHATSTAAGVANEWVTPRLAVAASSAAGKDPAPDRNEEAVSSDFSPVPDTEDDMTTEMPATEEGGTASDLPFTIPPTGVPEVDAILPRVLQRESAGDPSAVSPAGAEGLMQVMPRTQTDPGFGVEPVKDNSVAENVRVGSQYLAVLYQHYGGDMTLALMAYNWGPDSVNDWLRGGKKIAVPQETKDYVRAITGAVIEE